MNTPTPDQLAAITDISIVNPLSEFVFTAIETAEADSYADKVRYVVEQQLTPHAAHWFFITNLLGLWAHGGMQELLLCEADQIANKQWELKNAVEGFKAFGCNETAAFIAKLIPKAVAWSTGLAELNAKAEAGETVAEATFDAIWDEVDSFDLPFDMGFDGDPDVYEAMTLDVRAHPEKYIR